jgi:hypothetical protein
MPFDIHNFEWSAENLIGFSFTNTSPFMVPTRGQSRFVADLLFQYDIFKLPRNARQMMRGHINLLPLDFTPSNAFFFPKNQPSKFYQAWGHEVVPPYHLL